MLHGALIDVQLDGTRRPKHNSLNTGNTLLLSTPLATGFLNHSFDRRRHDIADHIDPGTYLQVRALASLQNVLDVDMGYARRRCWRVAMLQD